MKAKKSLGQHFLQDQEALDKIVQAANLKPDDKVLEIGPGTGALTQSLAESRARLILVEKDETLAAKLARNLQFTIYNFQSISNDQSYNFQNKSVIVSGDILEIDLPKLIEQNDFFDYKVVANIPYYITGKIIRLLFETKYPPKLVVLLVQKEVAERICAIAGKMSILAVAVQFFGKPKIIDIVPKESFFPIPKVDSAILRIVPFGNQIELQKDSKGIFRLVKMGFGSRRKTLLNNFAAGLRLPKEELAAVLGQCGMPADYRAQDLTVQDWLRLSKEFGLNKA